MSWEKASAECQNVDQKQTKSKAGGGGPGTCFNSCRPGPRLWMSDCPYNHELFKRTNETIAQPSGFQLLKQARLCWAGPAPTPGGELGPGLAPPPPPPPRQDLSKLFPHFVMPKAHWLSIYLSFSVLFFEIEMQYSSLESDGYWAFNSIT